MSTKSKAIVVLFALTAGCVLNGCGSAKMAPSNSWSGGGAGQAGSMARFTINSNYMYAVSDTSLFIFNLKKGDDPSLVSKMRIGWDVETIFSYKDLLFFGTRGGMLIYDIAKPETPLLVSTYQHIRSDDPVVVQDGYAYVTLRSRNGRKENNVLQVYDIKDPSSPILVKTYQMNNPWGLGIDRNKLFVCDGKHGLKVYDAAKASDLKLLETIEDINGYDVIPCGRRLIVSARDGIYQFDYNEAKLKKLSRIPVGY
ncbi:MAG: hypothetical protein HN350_19915 [Phycisphaerales bacterium]|nr:hypothetical protein [Phycisphaerales bacterium]